jgi:hypothetical protein
MSKTTKAKRIELSEQKWAAIDRIVREAAGKAAIECKLKSSLNPKYHRYAFFGCSDGSVVNVNIDAEPMTAHKLDEKLHTVKKWQRQRANQLKRDEAKLKPEQEKSNAKKAVSK